MTWQGVASVCAAASRRTHRGPGWARPPFRCHCRPITRTHHCYCHCHCCRRYPRTRPLARPPHPPACHQATLPWQRVPSVCHCHLAAAPLPPGGRSAAGDASARVERRAGSVDCGSRTTGVAGTGTSAVLGRWQRHRPCAGTMMAGHAHWRLTAAPHPYAHARTTDKAIAGRVGWVRVVARVCTAAHAGRFPQRCVQLLRTTRCGGRRRRRRPAVLLSRTRLLVSSPSSSCSSFSHPLSRCSPAAPCPGPAAAPPVRA